MKINSTRTGLKASRIYSHTLISLALILGLSLQSVRETPSSKKYAKSDSHEVSWDVKTYKIESQMVLALALTNPMGIGKAQLLTGCYTSGVITLYEQGPKGLKELRTLGEVKGGITDIKLLSMGGSLNKAVVANEEKGTLSIFDLKEDLPPMRLFHGAKGVTMIEIADIDGDGLEDIVPISYFGETNIWFQNDRHQGFVKRHFSSSKRKVSALSISDFDQDGDQDLLMASDEEKKISLLTNDGAGNFKETTLEDGITGVLDIAVLDMNMDGAMDVAYVSHNERTVQLLLNKEAGFDRKKISTKLHSLNNIRVFDLANDGRPDLIISSFDDNTIRIIENAEAGLREHQLKAQIPSPTDIAVKTDIENGKTVLYVSSLAKNRIYAIDIEVTN